MCHLTLDVDIISTGFLTPAQITLLAIDHPLPPPKPSSCLLFTTTQRALFPAQARSPTLLAEAPLLTPSVPFSGSWT